MDAVICLDYRGLVISSFSRTCIKVVLAMCRGMSFWLAALITLQSMAYVTVFLFRAANDCDLEPVAYEFFTQAFILYEEEVAWHPFKQDSKAQVTAIHLIIGTLPADEYIWGGEQRHSHTRPQRYLYFFEKGNPQMTSSIIQGLIELINTEMQSDDTTSDPSADAFSASTRRYISVSKEKRWQSGRKI